MKLKTSRFGELEIAEEAIIHFPDGIIGFENYKRYVILSEQENTPLRWLQSVDESELAFIIISPYLFMADYNPRIDRIDLTSLKLESACEAEILAIVVVPNNPKDMVANLMAPLIVNPKLCIGKQVIIRDSSYPTRYKILESYDKDPESAQTVSCK